MTYRETVRCYQERAEELRTIAQNFIDSDAQGMLLRLAQDYERMAEALEKKLPPS